ncbi:MAG TPA: glycerophosphoryl diester phosphodiesterase membrane domain-containing protein [Pseudolysinimonas sp.]|nr:glycerophosphoryl diester phosphodiesterase membrane domain-containing protein [Pseudolysinimonas sp.]
MSDSGSTGAPPAASSWRAPEAPVAVAAGLAEEPLRRRLAWTPPPKRGLVPLRPIPFGVILGSPFRLQRRTPRTTLGPALVISLVATTLAALLAWGLTVAPQAALDASYYEDYVLAQNLLGVLQTVGGFVPLVFAFAGNALLAGPVVVAASRAVLAERVSFRGLRWRLAGRTARLVGWTVVVFLITAGALCLASLLPVVVAVSSAAGGIFAFLAAFLEAIAILPVAGYLAARIGFTSHVIALEGLGVAAAIARSWRLTRRSGWRLFGMQLLIWVVVGIAAGILTLPISWALDLGVGLIFPTGATPGQMEAYLAARTVILTAVTAVVGAFGLVMQSACAALLYLDQRMRVEGLDLTLARYVDERQRGISVADPFPGGGAG